MCNEEEELDLFRTHTFSSKEDLLRLTSAFENCAFKAMWVLEGVADAEREYLENKKKGSRMKKPTYMGIGARVCEYKKKASGNSNHRNRAFKAMWALEGVADVE
jgi:hypothetical protein